MSKENEEILRAILAAGGEKAKKAAAEAIAQLPKESSDPAPVKQVKTRARRKGLRPVAGSLHGAKYFYAADGSIVDETGQPAPARVADILVKKDEMLKSIGETITPKKKDLQRIIDGQLKRVKTESARLAITQDRLLTRMPEVFGQFELAMRNMVREHEFVVQKLMKNNEQLQEQIVEALTGVKAPTKAAGSTTRPRGKGAGKAVGASKAARRTDFRNFRQKEVLDRARNIRMAGIKKTAGVIAAGAAIGSGVGALVPVGGGGGGGPPAGGGVTPYNGPGVAATGSAREAIDFFVSKGWTKEQAIGLAANLQAESNFKTNIYGDGGKAYGIAQWHPDRQAKFQQVYGKNIREANFKEQLEFVHWELNNTEKKAGDILRKATDAGQAAALIDQHYERSSGIHRQHRINIAQKYAKGEIPEAAPSTQTQAGVGAQGAPQGTAPSAATGPLLYVGDSVARGMSGLQGNGDNNSSAQVGRPPEKIYNYVAANIESLKGRNIVLSTGILNNAAQKDYIVKTLDLLKKNGASVTIAGTPNVPGSRFNHNDYLSGLASQFGFKFAGGFTPAADGVHPRNYGEYNRTAIGGGVGTPAPAPATPAGTPPIQALPSAPAGSQQQETPGQTTRSSGFIMPAEGLRQTSGFGERWGRQHAGLDLAGAIGTPIKAAADGTVSFAQPVGGYGNLVTITHPDGKVTRYGHLNTINVAQGAPVRQGELIGTLGNTGRSTGPHLHFEIRGPGMTNGLPGGTAVDPAAVLSGAETMMAEGAPSQRAPGVVSPSNVLQHAAMMAQSAPMQGRMMMVNNNRTIMHTRTVMQESGMSCGHRPVEAINPLTAIGQMAAVIGMGRALRIF